MPSNTTTSAGTETSNLKDETEASQYLKVAVRTLRNWRWRGEGPQFVRLGKRCVRYRQGDLEAFLEAGASGKVPA